MNFFMVPSEKDEKINENCFMNFKLLKIQCLIIKMPNMLYLKSFMTILIVIKLNISGYSVNLCNSSIKNLSRH